MGDSSNEEPPEFIDPITLTLMHDAVILNCGHSFSQESITEWFRQHSECPTCKTHVDRNDIRPNWALRSGIDRYKGKHGIKDSPRSSPPPVVVKKEEPEITFVKPHLHQAEPYSSSSSSSQPQPQTVYEPQQPHGNVR